MAEKRAFRANEAENYVATYDTVLTRAERDDFSGYDPFDGLESRIFKSLPRLPRSAAARMAWLQFVKRFPVNIRPLLRIPRGVNSKGIALFALGEISRLRAGRGGDKLLRSLLKRLDSMAIPGRDGSGAATRAFGYNFDWQSRAFFAPKGTPTIVPTAFAAKAYIEAFEILGDEAFLRSAEEVCRFILNDLRRPVESESSVCFSYTPMDNSVILNASLLAGEVLSRAGKHANSRELSEMALRTARFVLDAQTPQGSWPYGTRLRHKWVDNFHTAFMLSSLKAIYDNSLSVAEDADSRQIADAISRGAEYWIANFFLDSGAPKYFHNRTFPLDIHSSAAAIVTLCDLHDTRADALGLACRIADWTLGNLYGGAGHFFYQKGRFFTIKTEFIRWGQAWMAYALARLSESLGSKPQ